MSQRERKLAAIMFTDMVGYTAIGQRNESLSLALVEEQRKLLRPIISRHDGQEIKTMGDAFLVEFPSALEAVRCAYDIQRATREFNISLPDDRRIHLRVGVHLGDVVESEGDISGDAVNVASRIEALADDGGVCVTRQVYDQVQNKFEIPMSSLGSKSLKNVSTPLEVYKMVMPWGEKNAIPLEQLDKRRIAVLPFANMSPDPNDEYFADGITEEIISTVSGISGLSVISRTSVMGYKGTVKKVGEIGRELEVGSVLEGSFRKAGNRVRITTQLIEAKSDKHVWSQSYDRELDDVFAVQSDIAKQVANSLRVKILPDEERHIEKTPTKNPDAHALYLEGRYFWNERTKEGLTKAIDHFQRAINLDPEYALAYSGIADCYTVLGDHQHIPFAEAYSKSKEYAAKAVELDDTSAEAHTSLANAIKDHDRDIVGAEREFERATELNPNYATAHQWHSIALLRTGRIERALEEGIRAQTLDPLSPQIATFVGVVYDALGSYDRAEKQQLRALELQSDFPPAIGNLVSTYIHQKRYADARRKIQDFLNVTNDVLGCRLYEAETYALEGREAEARRILAEVDTTPITGHDTATPRIILHIAVGELDKAVELVEEEYEKQADWLGEISYDPLYATIRSNPRVVSVLRKVGVAGGSNP